MMVSGPTGRFYSDGHAVIVLAELQSCARAPRANSHDDEQEGCSFSIFQRRLQAVRHFGGIGQSVTRNPEDTQTRMSLPRSTLTPRQLQPHPTASHSDILHSCIMSTIEQRALSKARIDDHALRTWYLVYA